MEFDWDAWKTAEDRRAKALELTVLTRLEKARKEASRIAGLLRRADPGIGSIILFGSAARGDPSSEDFDIDIAVDHASRFSALESIALADGFKVDLIQLEFAPARLLDNIRREGMILHG